MPIITLKKNSLSHVLIWFFFSLSISRAFNCDFCELKFVKRADRNQHRLVMHDRKRQYICQVCGKSFVQKNCLYNHLQIHAGILPHKCEYCHKTFVRIQNLKSHTGVHTGEKPFKCAMCPETFKFSASASVHGRTHKIGDFFKCTICAMEFKQMRYLLLHYRNIHDRTKLYWWHF